MIKITSYTIAEIGFDNPQYFQGVSTVFSKHNFVFVGVGDNPYDSLEDAIESASQNDFDTISIENNLSNTDTTIEDIEEIGVCDWYYYTAIYIN